MDPEEDQIPSKNLRRHKIKKPPNPKLSLPEPEIATMPPEIAKMPPEIATMPPEIAKMPPEIATIPPPEQCPEPEIHHPGLLPGQEWTEELWSITVMVAA